MAIPTLNSDGLHTGGMSGFLKSVGNAIQMFSCTLKRATLEVTAQNEAAVRLYRQIGFRFRKTLYRMVEPQIYQLAPVSEPEWVV